MTENKAMKYSKLMEKNRICSLTKQLFMRFSSLKSSKIVVLTGEYIVCSFILLNFKHFNLLHSFWVLSLVQLR